MSTNDEDTWLETDAEAGDATGYAAAALLESVAETLREAPDGKRYDVDLTVEERG
jgi:hypothetical protein